MPMPPTPALKAAQKPALTAAGPRAGCALLKALAAILSGLEAILPDRQERGDGGPAACQSSHFIFTLS